MDAEVVAAVISALLGGAAGEVGRSAWSSLTGLVRRRFGDGSAEAAALESAESADSQRVIDLMVERGGADPVFGETLTTWARETQPLLGQTIHNTNTITGGTQTGPVIQTAYIGSLNFGGPQQ
ncbi:hypothetical protein [Nonomuraea longicatena]|uniref:Uncharacterized protein n=1 Tax=Nonomuraea longicatena TaxID=83682 RepID=A0ABN1PAD9_9ACTN